MNHHRALVFAAVLLLASPTLADPEAAQRVRLALAPRVDDQTFVAAAVSIDAAWADGALGTLGRYGLLPPGGRATAEAHLEQAASLLGRLHTLGVREVAAVLAVPDVRLDSGVLVAVACEAPQKDDIVAMARGLLPPPLLEALQLRWEGDVLLMGVGKTLERYASLTPSPRSDLLDPLTEAFERDAAAAAVVSPGADVRRVVRELWPTLAPPLRDLDARLAADGFRYLRLTVRQPPAWHAELTLAAADDASAQRFKRLADGAIDAGVRFAKSEPRAAPVAGVVEQAATLLRPRLEGAALRVGVAHDDGEIAALAKGFVVPAVAAGQQAARRSQQMNDMKQIALGLLNYESARGALPAAAAICDPQGKPLLSWRVAILPYLEQQALYDRFHLDEPWDSPHNLKLAEVLPGPYFGSASDALRAAGKTTYLVPVAAGTAFAPIEDAKLTQRKVGKQAVHFRQGLSYRKVTDGTSNTVLIAQVADEHAVLWTKPQDWRVDLADPLAQLRQAGRDGFVTAYMDGSARYFPFEVQPELLRNALTISGGEVDHP
ncbi:hypothetical protein Pla175_25460 [Pirellulimonas nuda]|uniref:DUF1559 domain-containing protein n=1 Tax=Pirellulimonas nuda TaxID=2528009 RepID=A0A518DCG0_9BACT|nr:DUF1559 domain-containing protein [Pirellulimonas nuda]QDU89159.1 hypothetical protein Pla175_25460 [Pirellulimonas nuda]